MTDTLYDEDFVIWTERQAEALRQAAREGSNLPLDFDNLAEEIEDLGREIRHKVESLVHQILVHLLKLGCSTALEPRLKWRTEIDEFRRQLRRQLRDNPTLRARLDEIIDDEQPEAFKAAARSFERFGDPKACAGLPPWTARGFTAAEIVEDGLYPAGPGSTKMVQDGR